MTPAQWLRRPIMERLLTDGVYELRDGTIIRAFSEAVAVLNQRHEIELVLLPTGLIWHSDN